MMKMGSSRPYVVGGLGWRIHAVLLVLACSHCGVDNRTGAGLAQALLDGPVRGYVAQQATAVAGAAIALEQATALAGGGMADLPAAQDAWRRARLAYDRGAALPPLIAPDLDQAIDGRFDNPLATTGLRIMESALFGTPPGAPAVLARFGSNLAAAAIPLPQAVMDTGRAVTIGALIGNMSAIAAVAATKLDGSDSPYAGLSHLSIEGNLIGLQTLYDLLSPPVQHADPALDQRIRDLFSALLAQLAGRASVDDVRDKVGFLRRCGELSQAILTIGTALGLSVTAPVDVT